MSVRRSRLHDGCCRTVLAAALALAGNAGCDAGAKASTTEVSAALGAGAAGPMALRLAPHRRRVRATDTADTHVRITATDLQGDLSGADFYVDGLLAGQQHVADVGGTGSAAAFDLKLRLPIGSHRVVAMAFDRGSLYSEGVTWTIQSEPRLRAMYVSHLDDGSPQQLLGNAGAVATLLSYAVAHGITTLIFYGVNATLASTERSQLAALLHDLRGAGVVELGAAVGETQLAVLEAFNQEHPADAFDLAVIEQEYWLGCAEPDRGYAHECPSCRTTCFPPFLDLVRGARQMADREAQAGRVVKLGAYLGYPSVDEIELVAPYLDRVLLNYNGASPGAAYERAYTRWGTMRARLQGFAGAERVVEIWPIFYACGEANMQPWLATHSMADTEAAFLDRSGSETAPFVDDVFVHGFAYYRYGELPDASCLEALPP